MMTNLPIDVRFAPVLDPGFVPAVLWNRAYQAQVAEQGGRALELALQRPDGSALRWSGEVLNAGGENDALTAKYVERLFIKGYMSCPTALRRCCADRKQFLLQVDVIPLDSRRAI